MAAIHITLQGKGGVGKSFVSSVLAQYFQSMTPDILCFDTDPVNNTFSRYVEFNAKCIEILNKDNNIDSRVFDGMVEELLEYPGTSVIDNGAATFVPWMGYSAENSVVEMLEAADKSVYIHTVLTGGQAMDDTIMGLSDLLKAEPKAKIVVWENEFFGLVERDGKNFVQSALYLENQDRFKGIMRIHRRNPDTFGKDVEAMVQMHLTFDEVMEHPGFTTMPRSRLRTIRKSLFEQLQAIGL